MKSITAAALAAAAASLVVQPLAAAELPREAGAQMERGTFVGARFRIPLGQSDEKAHAGLALTATQRAPGRAELRFAKGLELGYAGDDRLRLSLHGQPVSRLVGGREGPAGRKHGVSTLGWVAIGVGAVVLPSAASTSCAAPERSATSTTTDLSRSSARSRAPPRPGPATPTFG
jgi:hypothetical protein